MYSKKAVFTANVRLLWLTEVYNNTFSSVPSSYPLTNKQKFSWGKPGNIPDDELRWRTVKARLATAVTKTSKRRFLNDFVKRDTNFCCRTVLVVNDSYTASVPASWVFCFCESFFVSAITSHGTPWTESFSLCCVSMTKTFPEHCISKPSFVFEHVTSKEAISSNQDVLNSRCSPRKVMFRFYFCLYSDAFEGKKNKVPKVLIIHQFKSQWNWLNLTRESVSIPNESPGGNHTPLKCFMLVLSFHIKIPATCGLRKERKQYFYIWTKPGLVKFQIKKTSFENARSPNKTSGPLDSQSDWRAEFIMNDNNFDCI